MCDRAAMSPGDTTSHVNGDCGAEIYKAARCGVPPRYTQKGVQPMIARLRVVCLGLGLLSTVMACAGTPPAMPPPSAAPPVVAPPPPMAPPADVPPAVAPPAVAPLPYVYPPYSAGDRRPDTSQPSPYEQKMDEEER